MAEQELFGQDDPVEAPTGFGAGDPVETAPAPLAAASRGALGAGIEATGLVAGALKGGAIGSPIGPWGTAAGVLLGGLAGYLTGNIVRSGLSNVTDPVSGEPYTYETLEDLPPTDRPFAIAGEVLGGSAPFGGVPHALLARNIQPASKIIAGIMQTAKTMPKQFVAGEVAGAVGAAAGGAVAEKVLPGDVPARMAAESAGGLLSPSRLGLGPTRASVQFARKMWAAFSPKTRQKRAAAIVQAIVEEHGENPEAIARAMRAEPVIPGLAETAAASGRSPALLAIENVLKTKRRSFSTAVRDMRDKAFATMRQSIALLSLSGNPAALRAASLERKRYFDILFADHVRAAEFASLTASAQLPTETGRAEASTAMRTALDGAITDSRTHERSVWGQVDRNLTAITEGVLASYDHHRGEMLPEEPLPAIVEGWIRRHRKPLLDENGRPSLDPFTGEPEVEILPTNSGELIRLRSRMLAKAREAADKSEWSDARIYGDIAEAALDDLDNAFSGAPSAQYDTARQFSHSLHDTFTRTFAGVALDTGPLGRHRIPPELLAARALGTGREVGELNFRQLRAATSFLPDLGVGTEEHLASMLAAQETFLRIAAAETIDNTTNRINPRALANFRARHSDMLADFPETMRLLADAETAENTLSTVIGTTKQAQAAIKRDAAFFRLVDDEDPIGAVGTILSGRNPYSGLRQLAKLARSAGSDTAAGYTTAILRHTITRSLGSDGQLDFALLRRNLTQPIRGEGPSLLTFLSRENLIEPEAAKLFHDIIDEATAIQTGDPRMVDEIISNADGLTDFVLRLAGATAGGASAIAGVAGASLLAAHAGSRYMRQVFDRIPNNRIIDVLIEAALDKEMMTVLLTIPTTPGQRIRLALQMNAFLWHAGIHEPLDE